MIWNSRTFGWINLHIVAKSWSNKSKIENWTVEREITTKTFLLLKRSPSSPELHSATYASSSSLNLFSKNHCRILQHIAAASSSSMGRYLGSIITVVLLVITLFTGNLTRPSECRYLGKDCVLIHFLLSSAILVFLLFSVISLYLNLGF